MRAVPEQPSANLSEFAFLDAYEGSVLRTPQVVADTVLRALAFAPPSDRPALVGLLAAQLAEASRRLTSVFDALDDRRLAVADSLCRPLPGAAAWADFAQVAGTAEPVGMLRRLALDEAALESAELLRSLPVPVWLGELIDAFSADDTLVVPGPGDVIVVSGTSASGELRTTTLAAGENATVAMTDLIADLCSVARGFLSAYLATRRTAGRVP